MSHFVAFLRGINVGGHHKIAMSDLRQAFADLEFAGVKTLLASGNVVFEAPPVDKGLLRQGIEEKLRHAFGYEIGVILRSGEEIQALVGSDPFRGVEVTPETRLYVTFLSAPSRNRLPIPYETERKDFRILKVTPGEVISVLVISPGRSTPESMNILEKEFGRQVTTRNWNTVIKIQAAFL